MRRRASKIFTCVILPTPRATWLQGWMERDTQQLQPPWKFPIFFPTINHGGWNLTNEPDGSAGKRCHPECRLEKPLGFSASQHPDQHLGASVRNIWHPGSTSANAMASNAPHISLVQHSQQVNPSLLVGGGKGKTFLVRARVKLHWYLRRDYSHHSQVSYFCQCPVQSFSFMS